MPEYNDSIQDLLQQFERLLPQEQDQVNNDATGSAFETQVQILGGNASVEILRSLDPETFTALLERVNAIGTLANLSDNQMQQMHQIQVALEHIRDSVDESDFQQNLAFLREEVLRNELKNEMEYIKQLLSLESEDFAEAIKARCRERQAHPERYTNLSTVPQSLANELYWKIALQVFQPNTMKDMLEILMPDSKYALAVSASEQIPAQYQTKEEKKTYLKSLKANPQNQPADIQIQAIDILNEAPDFTRVSEFCFEEDMVFDVNQLNGLGIGTLSEVLKYIERRYFQLYKSILQHNDDLQVLKTDIDWYHNKGQSPAQALTQLIKGLKIGGEAYTGTIYASKSAIEAIGRFIVYFESLPEVTQEQLRALEYEEYSLGEIFDEQIAQGQCVETTAYELNALMMENADNEVLNSVSSLSIDYFNSLLQKYTVDKKPINPVKDLELIHLLPLEWVEKEISKFLINTDEKLIMLLLNFPTAFYDILLKNIKLPYPQDMLLMLADSIKNGFFNSEQKTALVKALSTNFNNFEINISMLQWAVSTKDLQVVSQTVALMPEDKYFDELTKIGTFLEAWGDVETSTVLQETLRRIGLEMLQKLLDLLPKDRRLEALYSPGIDDMSTFHLIAEACPEVLINFLNQFPKEKHEILMHKGDYSMPVINCLRSESDLEIILNIVSSLPDNERLEVLRSVDGRGISVLHYFLKDHEKLAGIIALLPIEQRFKALSIEDNNHNPLIGELTESDILKKLIELVPKQMRFDLLTLQTRDQKPVLLNSIHYDPEDFQEIINLLPAEKRGEALFKSIFCPDFVDDMITEYPDKIEKALYILPDVDRSKAANLISANLTDEKLTLFLKAMKDPIGFLNLLPERELADVIDRVDNNDDQYLLNNIELLRYLAGKLNSSDRMKLLIQRLLQKNIRMPAQFKDYIDLLPKDEYLKALRLKDPLDKTVLHFCTGNPDLLSEFLDLLHKENRFEIVNLKDTYNFSVLFYAAVINIESFNAIVRSLPATQRFEAISVTDGLFTLKAASKEPQLLATILDALEDKSERFKIVNTEISPGVSILSLSKENQTIREVLSNRIDKSILIKEAVYKANLKYSNYHNSGRKEEKYCRGRTGFFSGRRHGQTGLDNAQIFTDLMGRQTVLNEVCELLINKLEDKKTRFHRHSFASYVLDEMLDVLGLTGDEIQNLSPNNLNKYDKAMLSNILTQLTSLKDSETVSNSLA